MNIQFLSPHNTNGSMQSWCGDFYSQHKVQHLYVLMEKKMIIFNYKFKKRYIYTLTLHTYRKTGLWSPNVSKVFISPPYKPVLLSNSTTDFKKIEYTSKMQCFVFSLVQLTKVVFALGTLVSPGCDPKQTSLEV